MPVLKEIEPSSKEKDYLKLTSQLILNMERNRTDVVSLLINYEPAYVIQYEIDGYLQTLRNIKRLSTFLDKQQKGVQVTSMLPSNLPLYSLLLFVIVPAFTAGKVMFRPGTELSKSVDFAKLLQVLLAGSEVEMVTLKERIHLFVGPHNDFLNECISSSDLVIFTGRNSTRNIIKKFMKPGSYMINNGTGHNPIVIAGDCDINEAVNGVVFARFFNDGQDCAGPDSVFVHSSVKNEFLEKLQEKLENLDNLEVHGYNLHLGRIHRVEERERIRKIIKAFESEPAAEIIIPGGETNNNQVDEGVVLPTIILQPFKKEALNYTEVFGPILFLYPYDSDLELQTYFKSSAYQEHKMYISLFGSNNYIESNCDEYLIQKQNSHKNGVGILLRNKIIHLEDDGTVPYGGYGKNASSLIFKKEEKNGEGYLTFPMPTLVPQVIYDCFDEVGKQEKVIKQEFRKIIYSLFKDNLEFAKVVKGDSEKLKFLLCLKNKTSKISLMNINKLKAWAKFQEEKEGLMIQLEVETLERIMAWLNQLNRADNFRVGKGREENDMMELVKMIAEPMVFLTVTMNKENEKKLWEAETMSKILVKNVVKIIMHHGEEKQGLGNNRGNEKFGFFERF